MHICQLQYKNSKNVVRRNNIFPQAFISLLQNKMESLQRSKRSANRTKCLYCNSNCNIKGITIMIIALFCLTMVDVYAFSTENPTNGELKIYSKMYYSLHEFNSIVYFYVITKYQYIYFSKTLD